MSLYITDSIRRSGSITPLKIDSSLPFLLSFCALGLLVIGWVAGLGATGERLALWAHRSPVMPEVFWASLTMLGAGWAVVIIVAALDRISGAFTVAAVGSVLLGGGLVKLIKETWPIARPSQVLGSDQLIFIGEVISREGSMPSGHAAGAAALAVLVILLLRAQNRLTPGAVAVVLFAGACAVWSRVAVGAHWPADVAIGAALGILAALMCSAVVMRARWQGAPAALSHRVRMTAIAAVELLAATACFTASTGQPSAWLMQYLLGCLALASCAMRLRQLADSSHM